MSHKYNSKHHRVWCPLWEDRNSGIVWTQRRALAKGWWLHQRCYDVWMAHRLQIVLPESYTVGPNPWGTCRWSGNPWEWTSTVRMPLQSVGTRFLSLPSPLPGLKSRPSAWHSCPSPLWLQLALAAGPLPALLCSLISGHIWGPWAWASPSCLQALENWANKLLLA